MSEPHILTKIMFAPIYYSMESSVQNCASSSRGFLLLNRQGELVAVVVARSSHSDYTTPRLPD